MNTSAKMIIVLTSIAIISGGLLSAWDSVTAPRIEENRIKVLNAAITKVLPKFDSKTEQVFDMEIKGKLVPITLYVGLNAKKQPLGIAFKWKGNGFSPNLTLMVGVTPDFSGITGIEILEHKETPGLGDKIEGEWKDQYKTITFMNNKFEIDVIKYPQPDDPTSQIQAISGATISSKAVSNIILDGIKNVKDKYIKMEGGIHG